MVKQCATFKIILRYNITLTVPRSEFYDSIKHYASQTSTNVQSLLAMYQAQEFTHRELHLELPTIGLQQYNEDMYKQGRALQPQKANAWDKFKALMAPRQITLDTTRKDYLND